MPHSAATEKLFFERSDLDRPRLERIVDDALLGADDGELFLEYRQSEGLHFDDGRLKSASFDTTQGFGLRSVAWAPRYRSCAGTTRRPAACPWRRK